MVMIHLDEVGNATVPQVYLLVKYVVPAKHVMILFSIIPFILTLLEREKNRDKETCGFLRWCPPTVKMLNLLH
jgi:hypothetical protein